jgi:hypothetical protein
VAGRRWRTEEQGICGLIAPSQQDHEQFFTESTDDFPVYEDKVCMAHLSFQADNNNSGDTGCI